MRFTFLYFHLILLMDFYHEAFRLHHLLLLRSYLTLLLLHYIPWSLLIDLSLDKDDLYSSPAL